MFWVRRLHDGDTKISAVANLDFNIIVSNELVYLFAEYYHNGFGLSQMPTSVTELHQPLQSRLMRGEVFNVMRDYGTVGIAVPWHPLLNQALTFLFNLNDSSSPVQTSIGYDPGDHQRLQIGLVKPLGRAGDEFGGIPLFDTTTTTGVCALAILLKQLRPLRHRYRQTQSYRPRGALAIISKSGPSCCQP